MGAISFQTFVFQVFSICSICIFFRVAIRCQGQRITGVGGIGVSYDVNVFRLGLHVDLVCFNGLDLIVSRSTDSGSP